VTIKRKVWKAYLYLGDEVHIGFGDSKIEARNQAAKKAFQNSRLPLVMQPTNIINIGKLEKRTYHRIVYFKILFKKKFHTYILGWSLLTWGKIKFRIQKVSPPKIVHLYEKIISAKFFRNR